MAIKVANHFYIEGHIIITLKPNILLGEACDVARDNLCNVLIRTYKGWELKREKNPVKVKNDAVVSYMIDS